MTAYSAPTGRKGVGALTREDCSSNVHGPPLTKAMLINLGCGLLQHEHASKQAEGRDHPEGIRPMTRWPWLGIGLELIALVDCLFCPNTHTLMPWHANVASLQILQAARP